jgi:hypothetical protein
MTHHTGTGPPPVGPPVMPQYFPPPPHHERRWPQILTAAVIGALIAAVGAVAITIQLRAAGTDGSNGSAPVTVTVPAPTPISPAPLPATQADRKTCEQGYIPAGQLIAQAKAALATLPQGIKIGQPAVPTNPEWSAAAKRAADFYKQASDALEQAVAPGTTPILAEAAATAVKELRLMSDTIGTNSVIDGNAGEIGNATAKEVSALCYRFAP